MNEFFELYLKFPPRKYQNFSQAHSRNEKYSTAGTINFYIPGSLRKPGNLILHVACRITGKGQIEVLLTRLIFSFN